MQKGGKSRTPIVLTRKVAVLGVNFAVSVTYNLEVGVRNDD